MVGGGGRWGGIPFVKVLLLLKLVDYFGSLKIGLISLTREDIK